MNLNKTSLAAAVFSVAMLGATSVSATTLNDGLLAWYPFNGNAADETGNGNDGTVTNAALANDRNGNANSAYEFNGADSVIDIGAGVKPALPHTISLWFETDVDGFTPLFRNDRVDGGSFRHGSFLAQTVDRQLQIVSFSGFSVIGTRYSQISPVDSYEFGEWTMVTAVNDTRGNQRLFINGSEVATTAGTGTGSGFTYSSASGAIGHVDPTGNNNSGFARTSFDGSIDDVGVWDRILTDAEVLDLYNGVDPLGATTQVPVPPAFALMLGALALTGFAAKRKATA